MTSYSGEFGEILFKHRQVRCKKKHILPPQAATSSGFICLADYAATSKYNGASSSAVALRAMAGQASKASGVW